MREKVYNKNAYILECQFFCQKFGANYVMLKVYDRYTTVLEKFSLCSFCERILLRDPTYIRQGLKIYDYRSHDQYDELISLIGEEYIIEYYDIKKVDPLLPCEGCEKHINHSCERIIQSYGILKSSSYGCDNCDDIMCHNVIYNENDDENGEENDEENDELNLCKLCFLEIQNNLNIDMINDHAESQLRWLDWFEVYNTRQKLNYEYDDELIDNELIDNDL